MKFVKILFALIIVAVLFKFNLDNPESTSVVIYHYTSPAIPVGLLLMTTLVLGMIAASFGSTIKIMQLKRQLNKLQPDTGVTAEPKKKSKKEKKKEEKAAAKTADKAVSEPVPESTVEQDAIPEPVVTPAPTAETVSENVVITPPPVADPVMPATKEEQVADAEIIDEVRDVIELPQEGSVVTDVIEKKE